MKRIKELFNSTKFQFWLICLVVLMLGSGIYLVLKFHPDWMWITPDSAHQNILVVTDILITVGILTWLLIVLFSSRIAGGREYLKAKALISAKNSAVSRGVEKKSGSVDKYGIRQFCSHLRRRYGLFWRRKVRLLLITGDETAIDQLLPGLQSQQWLEGNRTVLIYGGTWGFIRWLKQGKRQRLDRSQWMLSFTAPDGRTLQWVLRSQLGKGPLALLTLRNFSLPEQIFSVDASATSQTLDRAGNLAMEGME